MDQPALSDADQAAIIQLAMELIVKMEARLKSKGHPTRLSEFMVISKENISVDLLPKLPGFRFSLMGDKEIRKKCEARARLSIFGPVGAYSKM